MDTSPLDLLLLLCLGKASFTITITITITPSSTATTASPSPPTYVSLGICASKKSSGHQLNALMAPYERSQQDWAMPQRQATHRDLINLNHAFNLLKIALRNFNYIQFQLLVPGFEASAVGIVSDVCGRMIYCTNRTILYLAPRMVLFWRKRFISRSVVRKHRCTRTNDVRYVVSF